MQSVETESFTIVPPDYRKAIDSESDFYIQFHTVTPESDGAMVKCVRRCLEHYDLNYFTNEIVNIIKELINNAIKANLKRVYFKLKNLDIVKTDEYRTGMECFKEDTMQEDAPQYQEYLEKSDLVVRIAFKTTAEKIYINVINNVSILDAELSKINARIKKAFKYEDISEAFDEVLDESEGAGLGLIMAMMVFKNMGLRPDSFRIYRKNSLTIAAIAIPRAIKRKESRDQIAEEILKELDNIPSLPENILRIQKLCADTDATIREIADAISHDPGLTTSLMKLANSAGYITLKKTETLEEAVKIIGIRGINALVLASGVHRVIESRYKRFESVWTDSYKRAAYAQKIVMQIKNSKSGNFVYLAALLADIGLIVMLSLRSEHMTKLREIAGYKGIDDTNLIEEISLGISHGTLGSMIFNKWNFNESLMKAVEFHHRPHMAPEELRELVSIIYLADCMVEIDKKRFRYELISDDVIEFFKLEEKKTFEMLHNAMRESYEGEIVSARGASGSA